jgi:predicted permease
MMTHDGGQAPTQSGTRWPLNLASHLVPADRREEWRQAWEGELEHWLRRERKRGHHPSRFATTIRALGCLPHAAWERAQEAERALRDVRHGVRRLLRTPGFTLVAVFTLALGIGATAAILSVVNAVLLRPLPYDQPEDLLVVWHSSESLGYDRIRMSPAIFLTIESEQATLEAFGSWFFGGATVTGLQEPEQVDILVASDGVFSALRLSAAHGRLLQARDGDPDAPPTAVLSHGYWSRRFGADPAAVGRSVDVDGVSTQIVGVLPAGVGFLDYEPDLYLPVRIDPEDAALLSFDYNGLARRKTNTSLDAIHADLARLIPLSVERYAWTTPERAEEFGLRPNVHPLREQVVGRVARNLWILLGAVGLVLLLACVNVANLLLVRAESRRREVAVRRALGGGRSRIARHFATENILISLAGGAAGILLAMGLLRLLLRVAPANLPRSSEIGLDSTILLATLVASIGVGLLFTLLPLVQRGERSLSGALRDGGRGGTSGRSRNRVRNALASLQVALSLVLLLGSALMVRSFLTLRAIDPGFDRPEEVLTFRLYTPRAQTPDDDEAIEIHRRIVESLGSIPEVESVGLASGFTMELRSNTNELYTDESRTGDAFDPSIHYKAIGADYFGAMGIPLLAGRTIRWDDITDRRPVGLITENLAVRHWGSAAAAVGRRIRHSPEDPWREVIGVVSDVRDAGITSDPPGVVYWPVAVAEFLGSPSWVRRNLAYVVRTGVMPPTTVLSQVRQAVWTVDPDLPLANIRTLDEVARRDMAPTRFMMTLLLVAAAVALVLGTVGVYGVISYAVSQRTQEIGIRMALGATAADIKRLGLRHGLVIALSGGVLGLILSVVLGRTIETVLYGVSPSDPFSVAVIATVLGGVVLLASYVPARRATRVEPTTALRAE